MAQPLVSLALAVCGFWTPFIISPLDGTLKVKNSFMGATCVQFMLEEAEIKKKYQKTYSSLHSHCHSRYGYCPFSGYDKVVTGLLFVAVSIVCWLVL